MSISFRLKEFLEKRSLSIKDAAESCGIPYRSMQNYLRGEREPNAEALIKLNTHLGISIDWLLAGKESISEPMNKPQELTRREKIFLEMMNKLSESEQQEILQDGQEMQRISQMEADMIDMKAEIYKLKKSG